MQEHRPLVPGPNRSHDEDGDPLITSQAVELRELNGEGRCLPCTHRGRACHIQEGLRACLQCSATASIHECMFVRKVVRQERLSYFSWSELTGINHINGKYLNNNTPYHGHFQHHRDHSGSSYQEGPRPAPHYGPEGSRSVNYGPYSAGSESHERGWNGHPPPQAGPPPPAQPLYNNHMPPIKRQRTDAGMYDGQDVFGHGRQASLPGAGTAGWHSPRRSEYQLPEIRPFDSNVRRPDEPTSSHGDERLPVVAAQDRNNVKTLDLKPPAPMIPAPLLKRKLDPETQAQELSLPHRCLKCDAAFKTPAELKKHFARHEPQYFCTIANCPRGRDGFTTKNDLDRHRKTMHKILSPNDRFWKCFFPDCAKTEKVWPRLDNFKAHIVRMHGQQYVQENVARAEEWWDATKGTPMLSHSPEATMDLVPIEPKPPQEQSRLGVNSLLQDGAQDHVNGRRRHLSAEGRQEAAVVRELGACLRCSLLKEKCDDSRVCVRCNGYSNKHFNGTLICRRGNMADYLLPLIPLFTVLPEPEPSTRGLDLMRSDVKFAVTSFTDLLKVTDVPTVLEPFYVATNSFTSHLFAAMDDVLARVLEESHAFDPDFRAEVGVLKELQTICFLLTDTTLKIVGDEGKSQSQGLVEHLRSVRVELRGWYEELDNSVFDWKSRHLEFNHHPMKKWMLFFSTCVMLLMERLTVVVTRAWAQLEGISEENTDDEAADTLCALLEFKFQRQTLAQHHFISMLVDERCEPTNGYTHPLAVLAFSPSIARLQDSMGFLRETKGFETWKWLHEHMGEAEPQDEEMADAMKDEDGDVSDTIEVNQMSSGEERHEIPEKLVNGSSRSIRSRRSASKALSTKSSRSGR